MAGCGFMSVKLPQSETIHHPTFRKMSECVPADVLAKEPTLEAGGGGDDDAAHEKMIRLGEQDGKERCVPEKSKK